MGNRVVLNRDALRAFIDLMDTVAEETGKVLNTATPRLARAGAELTPGAAYRGGIKVTLGAMDVEHSGRYAGQLMAARIADTLNFVISLEEGSRALGQITRRIVRELDNQDSISATELEQITASVPASAAESYGVVLTGHRYEEIG